jgi:hypothetical protein
MPALRKSGAVGRAAEQRGDVHHRALERAERLRVYEEAAAVLVDAERQAPGSFTDALAEIAEKLPPDDAARVCTPVVDVLTKALGVETEPLTLARLANAWAPLAKYVADPDARRVRSEAAQKLVQVLSTTKWDVDNNLESLSGFSEIIYATSRLAAGLDGAHAAEISRNVARMQVALVKETAHVSMA